MNEKQGPTVADAHKIAVRGRRVFLLVSNRKTPLRADWPQRATIDASAIDGEWMSYPTGNIGYTLPGLVAIDIDTVEGHDVDGPAAWVEMTAGRTVPQTWTVVSPTGSTHLVFTLPEGVRVSSGANMLGPGVDVKSGPGAYLVGPGSVTDRGTYELVSDLDPAPCPPWLLDELDRTGRVTHDVSPDRPYEPAPPPWEPHGRFGESIPVGRRHAVLLAFCCSMRARRFSWAEAERLLGERWADCEQPPGHPYSQAEAVALLEDVWTRYPSGTTEGEMGQGGPDADDVVSSWAPMDLGPYLAGTVPRPEPAVGLARTDGLRFIYPGKEHAVIGEMESGKSWFMAACAAAELRAGHRVVYVHFEEADPSDTVERLLALGVSKESISSLFSFVGPEHRVTPDVLSALLALAPSLVLLDGVNEAMALHAWGIRDEDGAAAYRRDVVKPCTRAGVATLSADHVAKDPERRGRTSIGSVHKVNGLTGSLILLDNAESFGRDRRGRSRVFVTKDRPGHLRRNGKPTAVPGQTYMGELVVDDTRSSVSYLDLQVFAPNPDDHDPAVALPLAEQVHAVVSNLPDMTVASMRVLFAEMRKAGHEAREAAIRSGVDDLLVSGRLVEHPGPRNAKGYRAVPTAAHDQEEN